MNICKILDGKVRQKRRDSGYKLYSMRFIIVISIVVAMAKSGNVNAQSESTQEIDNQINAVYAAFRKSYNTLDVELLESLYVKDAFYGMAGGNGGGALPLQTTQQMIMGMNGFMDSLKGAGKSGKNKKLEITFLIKGRFISGSVKNPISITDVGYYRFQILNGDVVEVSEYGKMINFFVNDQGEFKFKVDFFSTAPKIDDFESWDQTKTVTLAEESKVL